MATYIINEAGSSACTYPPSIAEGDILRFNVTSLNEDNKYQGSMLVYTFPFDCEVSILACGARGGKGNGCSDYQVGKGAGMQGDFTFKRGDTLLMCIGQAGTEYTTSLTDGATGAGGGGTFVVKKMEDGTGDVFSGDGIANGWKVTPLVISAGGNGGRDVGYSGTGIVYHGVSYEGKLPIYGDYSGGGYRSYHNNANSGKSFLLGASGATTIYERSKSKSCAGFGCGGGNKDDAEGGGGGGYYGGTTTSSATSYISPEATNVERYDGYNFGEGFVDIRFNKVTAPVDVRCTVNGVIKQGKSMKVKVADEWKDVVGTRIKINGAWK